MEFLKSLGETVNNAVDFVVEKNRKFTKISKLKRLIKKESDAIIRSYITLGKHYYSDLRNVPDKEMQKVCKDIDLAKSEIKKLRKKLVEINSEQDYTKFRNLVDDEPIDIELYVSDACTCDSICKDGCHESSCDCEENGCNLEDNECINLSECTSEMVPDDNKTGDEKTEEILPKKEKNK